jgi:HEAT repeat protein
MLEERRAAPALPEIVALLEHAPDSMLGETMRVASALEPDWHARPAAQAVFARMTATTDGRRRILGPIADRLGDVAGSLIACCLDPEDETASLRALELLARRGVRSALPEIVRLLAADGPGLRRAAGEAATALDPAWRSGEATRDAFASFLRSLSTPVPPVGTPASLIAGLASIDADLARRSLLPMLADLPPTAGDAARAFLGPLSSWVSEPGAEDLVRSAVRHLDGPAAERASSILGEIGGPRVTEILLDALGILGSEDAVCRGLRVLGNLDPASLETPRATKTLHKLCAEAVRALSSVFDLSPVQRPRAWRAAHPALGAKLTRFPRLAELVALDAHNHPAVREAALLLLPANRASPDLADRLADLAADEHEDTVLRAAALRTLGRLEVPGSGRALLPLLETGDPLLREAAVEAAGRLRHRPAAGWIAMILRDWPHEGSRHCMPVLCTRALLDILGEEALTLLLPLLKHRASASYLLAHVGIYMDRGGLWSALGGSALESAIRRDLALWRRMLERLSIESAVTEFLDGCRPGRTSLNIVAFLDLLPVRLGDAELAPDDFLHALDARICNDPPLAPGCEPAAIAKRWGLGLCWR